MYLDVLSPRALRRVSGAERTINLPFRVNPSTSWQFSLGRLRFSFETTPVWYQLTRTAVRRQFSGPKPFGLSPVGRPMLVPEGAAIRLAGASSLSTPNDRKNLFVVQPP